jgi:hypothetical protein
MKNGLPQNHRDINSRPIPSPPSPQVSSIRIRYRRLNHRIEITMNRRTPTIQISRLRRHGTPLQNTQSIVSFDLSEEVCDNLIEIVSIAAKSSQVQESSPSAEMRGEVVSKVRCLLNPEWLHLFLIYISLQTKDEKKDLEWLKERLDQSGLNLYNRLISYGISPDEFLRGVMEPSENRTIYAHSGHRVSCLPCIGCPARRTRTKYGPTCAYDRIVLRKAIYPVERCNSCSKRFDNYKSAQGKKKSERKSRPSRPKSVDVGTVRTTSG